MSQKQLIHHKNLGLKELCSRWMPHNLIEAAKTDRVTGEMPCTPNSRGAKFGVGHSKADGTWISCYDPETNQQSTVWVYRDEPRPISGEKYRTYETSCIHPDVAPCDFILFAKVKNQLRSERFSSPEAAVEENEKDVPEATREEWHTCFRNWFIPMKKCIYANR
ncbi:hypothetical protein EVAR_98445_1 [Eumeta japonica]|uniref:Mariner Mos1 transposase n=1 Tax=Eumeta variegata TaxID=151549 RepID=A0A4C1YSB5_EUMVA|nr:hypothetical protein EVAR_98445_1 [Eumeta japonica]